MFRERAHEHGVGRPKHNRIISVSVCSNSRDLLFLALAQNDQQILTMVFRREFRTVPSAKVSLSEKERLNVLQLRVAAPLWLASIRKAGGLFSQTEVIAVNGSARHSYRRERSDPRRW